MRYKPGHKEEARAHILASIGRGFRRRGLGGIGVDGLAKEAGVTSGAFYSHFASKDEAFKAAVAAGMVELANGVRALKAEHGKAWLPAFIDFYLGPKRSCELGDACVFQVLSAEVGRADLDVRTAYEVELRHVVREVADGLSTGSPSERDGIAWALLALLAGGVTVARALADDILARGVALSIRDAALRLIAE
jgi:AcrR family transcriptional regulator